MRGHGEREGQIEMTMVLAIDICSASQLHRRGVRSRLLRSGQLPDDGLVQWNALGS